MGKSSDPLSVTMLSVTLLSKIRAPKPLLRWRLLLGQLAWKLQHLGLKGHQSQRDQEQILILNTINLLAILPVKVVLGCSYALAGLWTETLLMVATFGLVAALMTWHSRVKIGLSAYRQSTLIISFCCPFALTFLLGGYHNSSLVMLWSLLTPMLALLLDKAQTARRWLGFFALCNLLLIGLYDLQSSSESYDIHQHALLAFNGIGVCLLIYGCLHYLQQKYQHTIQQLDQFASLVAHELRTPLTSISLGIGHSLRQREGLSTSQILALETAQAEADRSQLILTDLLQISKAPSSPSDMTCQRLDPYPMLMSLATHAQQQLGVNVQVHCSLGVSERLLWAAPNPCEQMAWNLIVNSAKYADPSHPIELAITADPGDTYLQIQVADRGTQLSSQQCQDIFTPFYRLASPKVQPGSGLGLTLVRRFAEAMGGSVRARPQEGGGLVVSLALPRAVQAPGPWQWDCQPQANGSNGADEYAGGGGQLSSRRPKIRTHPKERASYPSNE